eukprot:12407555-Karenia_brevis.AAC.1
MLEQKIDRVADDLKEKVDTLETCVRKGFQCFEPVSDYLGEFVSGIDEKLGCIQNCVAPFINRCYYDQLQCSIQHMSTSTIIDLAGCYDGHDGEVVAKENASQPADVHREQEDNQCYFDMDYYRRKQEEYFDTLLASIPNTSASTMIGFSIWGD